MFFSLYPQSCCRLRCHACMETFRGLVTFHLAMAALHTILCSIVIYITLTRRCFPLPSGDCDTVYI